jgi:signal peptidase II
LSSSLLLLVGCDHATKAWAEASLGSGRVELVDGVLGLTYTRNHDVAFSLLRWLPADARMATALTAGIAATVLLLIFWWQRRRSSLLAHGAFALVLAGAAGNLIDRGVRGYVVDFIHLSHWPVFNVADAFIVAGAALLGWSLARDRPERLGPLPPKPVAGAGGRQASD